MTRTSKKQAPPRCHCGRALRLLSWARRDQNNGGFRFIIPLRATTWAATYYDINAWVGDGTSLHDILTLDGQTLMLGVCTDG